MPSMFSAKGGLPAAYAVELARGAWVLDYVVQRTDADHNVEAPSSRRSSAASESKDCVDAGDRAAVRTLDARRREIEATHRALLRQPDSRMSGARSVIERPL